MAALVDYVNYKLTGAMIVALYNAPIPAKGSYNVHLIVMELVILICLLGIPEMVKTQNPTLDGLIVSKYFIQRLDYFSTKSAISLNIGRGKVR